MATSEDKPTTEAVEEAPVKKTTRRAPAKKPEVVAEAPPVETKEVDTSIAEATDSAPVERSTVTADEVGPKAEYEFLEELPNKQQAAPVTETAAGSKETRITKAIDGDETEPELVDHDKAFDKETAEGAPPIEGKPEPEPAPAKVDQPVIKGQTESINVLPSGTIEDGETEPKQLDKADEVFAEGTSKTLEPNPGRQGGEGDRYDSEAYNAATSEAEAPKRGKAKKTDNPKLAKLKAYGA